MKKRTFRVKSGTGPHQTRAFVPGSNKRDRKTYKPGETFEAYYEDVAPFMHKIEAIEDGVVISEEALVKSIDVDLFPCDNDLVVKHVGHGKYNVVNAGTGKSINEDCLTKEEAQALLQGNINEAEHETVVEPAKDLEKPKRVYRRRRTKPESSGPLFDQKKEGSGNK